MALLKLFDQLLARIGIRRYFSLNKLDQQLEVLLNHDGGFFVELGANDGVTQSNSLYFEKRRGWKGLLVEPVPHNYLKCLKNRSRETAVYCAACVPFDYTNEYVRIAYANLMSAPIDLESDIENPKKHAESGQRFLPRGETVVEFGAIARPLNELLIDCKAPPVIDFLSLDVEGAELGVLQGIDHSKFRFRYMVIESRDVERIASFLATHHYKHVRNLSQHDYLFEDSLA